MVALLLTVGLVWATLMAARTRHGRGALRTRCAAAHKHDGMTSAVIRQTRRAGATIVTWDPSSRALSLFLPTTRRAFNSRRHPSMKRQRVESPRSRSANGG